MFSKWWDLWLMARETVYFHAAPRAPHPQTALSLAGVCEETGLESRHLYTEDSVACGALYPSPRPCTRGRETQSSEGRKKKKGGDLIERDLFIKKPWIQLHSFNLRNVVMAFLHGDMFRWEYAININSRKETIKVTQFKTEQTWVFD